MQLTKKEFFLISIIFAALLVAGNNNVFYYEPLIQDDYQQFREVLIGSFDSGRLDRYWITPPLQYLYMSVVPQSVYLARLLIILTQMLPLSMLIYFFFRYFFKANRGIALFAGVYPQILPMQFSIPVFIVGSYMVHSFLFFFLSLVLMLLSYSTKNDKKYIILSVFTYFLAVQSAEINIFFIVPMVFFTIHLSQKKMWPVVARCSGHILIAAGMFFKIIYFPWGNQGKTTFSFEIIQARILDSLIYLSPFGYYFKYSTILLILFLILLLGFRKKIFKKEEFTQKIFSPFLLLSICSFIFFAIGVFFVTKYFSDRYLFYFGCAFYISYSIILNSVSNTNGFSQGKNKRLLNTITYGFVACLFIISFLSKTYQYKNLVSYMNSQHSLVKNTLVAGSFPPHSQLIFFGHSDHGTGEWSPWGTGLVQYISKRPDLSGLVTVNFPRRALSIREPNFQVPATGIDINKPLYVFKQNNHKIKRVGYAVFDHANHLKLFSLNLKKPELIASFQTVDQLHRYLEEHMIPRENVAI